MKKTLLILIISSFFITSLNAGSYIKVAAFSQTENFYGSVDSIESLGFNAAYIEKNGIIRVFAGPFNNNSELNKALLTIKKNIAADAYPVEVSNVITVEKSKTAMAAKDVEEVAVENEPVHKSVIEDDESVILEEQEAVEETDKNISENTEITKNLKEEQKPIMKDSNKKYFVGLNMGISRLGVEENTVRGTLPLDITLKKSGTTFGVEGGYNINEKLFTTLNYQYTDLTNVAFHDIFTSLNYRFGAKNGFSPYVGALLDYNIKRWKNRPLDSLSSSDKANQVAGGVQLGSDYNIADDISLFALYRYIHLNYTTTITDSTNTKEIKYNHEQNFNIGLKYSF